MSDVFEGKSLQDLLKEVHGNTLDKRQTISDIVTELRSFIKDINDIVVVAPIIKDYLDLLIKNDEHLIKVGTIVQRIISAESYKKGGGASLDDLLSDDEKERLIADAKNELEAELNKLEAKTTEAIDKVTQ
jgi:hypothetical protein